MKPSPRPTAAKPSPNLSELARLHGVSREALRAWRVSGLDLADEQALRAKIATSRSPAASAGKATDGGETLASARLRRERALADRAEIEVARRRGELLELHHAEQAFTAVGAAVGAALRKIPSELPDMLEGLNPSSMRKVLLEYQNQLFSDVHRIVETNFANIKSL